jgi:catechol 2,3-dioxygenase-like lactoylglutathione lyase family enzyme
MAAPNGIDLDHVALAFEHAWDGLDRYVGDLGGDYIGGGPDPGFAWFQARYANGMKVEMLEPADVEVDDFLRRFLDRNGPGPHHMTFKVPDIHVAIERATTAGYPPVRVNLRNDDWKEAFIHPKASHGIVVQMAQSGDNGMHPPLPVPAPRGGVVARLDRIVHLVADLEAARAFFTGVLDARVDGECETDLGRAVDVAWPGPGRVRLVAPSEPAATAWLGARNGRVHHLAFSAPAPFPLAHARRVASDTVEIPPEHNLGTRLRLTSTR